MVGGPTKLACWESALQKCMGNPSRELSEFQARNSNGTPAPGLSLVKNSFLSGVLIHPASATRRSVVEKDQCIIMLFVDFRLI